MSGLAQQATAQHVLTHMNADCLTGCGCIVVLQEMLDFCGKHGIHADVEVGVLTVRSAGL